eukprot:c11828_g1_i1.p1 GENE.c11828_g1_i1~~c11828_g1_i1.p1  ORF type:complete len:545 (-),score=109.16 c11828_g1_i1:52-1479(-)
MAVKEFVGKFEHLEAGARIKDNQIVLVGRVGAMRSHSASLVFVDLEGADGGVVQVMASKKEFDEIQNKVPMSELFTALGRGDVIAAYGIAGKTNRGELSLVCSRLTLLSPCLHQLPDKNSLENPDIRCRYRYLDLMVNTGVKEVFLMRTKIIQKLRKFLDDRNFVEVETSILASSGGGASARPFITHSHGLSEDLQMRISPELNLKMLVIGGMERVYEIGKQFRNEGVDKTHNPEFTMCEFYAAHHTLDDLIPFTEQVMAELVSCVAPDLVVPSPTSDEPINFCAPFRQLDFVDDIERILNTKLPNVNDPASIPQLEAIYVQHNFPLPAAPRSLPQLLDGLAGHVLEPLCHQPTFIVNHPLSLSPLSKENPNKPGFAHRFELFVNGFEVVNAYSELNNPHEQSNRFEAQWKQKDEGEKLLGRQADQEFCRALEFGMPPTAGWGMGIDRFCMLLAGKVSIRDVLLFPTLRSKSTDQ